MCVLDYMSLNTVYIQEFTLVDIFHLVFGANLTDAGSEILFNPLRSNVGRYIIDLDNILHALMDYIIRW